MLRFKTVLLAVFVALIAFNYLSSFLLPSPLRPIKSEVLSLSPGQRYFGLINLWYYLAQNQRWDLAVKLEPWLDPADYQPYELAHNPPLLRQRCNELAVKPNKTADDWIELARIQYLLGKNPDALNSLQQARNLDPVRDDISKVYFEFSSLKQGN